MGCIPTRDPGVCGECVVCVCVCGVCVCPLIGTKQVRGHHVVKSGVMSTCPACTHTCNQITFVSWKQPTPQQQPPTSKETRRKLDRGIMVKVQPIKLLFHTYMYKSQRSYSSLHPTMLKTDLKLPPILACFFSLIHLNKGGWLRLDSLQ